MIQLILSIPRDKVTPRTTSDSTYPVTCEVFILSHLEHTDMPLQSDVFGGCIIPAGFGNNAIQLQCLRLWWRCEKTPTGLASTFRNSHR